MTTLEIVLLATTIAPIVLGLVGRLIRTLGTPRAEAIGSAFEGAGVDVAKVREAMKGQDK